jgi:hypothetical protein
MKHMIIVLLAPSVRAHDGGCHHSVSNTPRIVAQLSQNQLSSSIETNHQELQLIRRLCSVDGMARSGSQSCVKCVSTETCLGRKLTCDRDARLARSGRWPWGLLAQVRSRHKKTTAAMAPRAAAAAASSPIGVALSNTHEIGRSIGKGEFGEVYAVKGGKTKSNWVVKVTAVPTKITKKQNSPAECAARRLYYEYLIYSNCRNLSGSILPLLPSIKTDKIDMYYNNLDGACLRYRVIFLALRRLAS